MNCGPIWLRQFQVAERKHFNPKWTILAPSQMPHRHVAKTDVCYVRVLGSDSCHPRLFVAERRKRLVTRKLCDWKDQTAHPLPWTPPLPTGQEEQVSWNCRTAASISFMPRAEKRRTHLDLLLLLFLQVEADESARNLPKTSYTKSKPVFRTRALAAQQCESAGTVPRELPQLVARYLNAQPKR